MLDSVEVYDPEKNTWYELNSHLDSPSMGVGVCTHGGQLWVIGGMAQSKGGKIDLVKDVKRYDPNNQSVNNFWFSNGQSVRNSSGEEIRKRAARVGLVQRFMSCDTSEGNAMIGCFIYSGEKPSLSTAKRAVGGIANGLSVCVSALWER
ncbi:uncharacterized protein CEXT_371031 [Caerostris extrusa]|uniref:Uncharacterized protein n=1 Tax=Caerostris extrusa TaxID=172846 RepID=A0AAV4RHL4_CAEEX|nr:uncharacterized protein CEXT_371031 [Caerostris extrusa]